MNKLKHLLGGDVPLITVGFSDKTQAAVIEDGIKVGLDVAELRIDLYSSFEKSYVLNEVKRFNKLPTVATIRTVEEGGKWSGSEEDRLALFKSIINDVDAIDIELASDSILEEVIAATHAAGKLVFISYHNFTSTPDLGYLTTIAKKAKELGADVIKIATTPKNKKDLQVLASFTVNNSELGLVTIAMGSDGVSTRLFFPALGSLLTYAYIGQSTAPGQLNFTETFYLLRKFYPEFNQRKINSLELMEAV